MAKLKCISSGSHGNSYIVECENETLLLELGVAWPTILDGLNYNLEKITGCLVSHKHNDHAKSIPNAIKNGVSVFSCEEVASMHKGVKVLKSGVLTTIGAFDIFPLSLKHDCECYGYIIKHPEFGKMVFATDCFDFKYKIKDVNHWLIECNHSEDLMIENMCNNIYSQSASNNHLEINKTIKALQVNRSCELQNIVLLHLSQGNANKVDFVNKVKNDVFFDNVFVADEELEIELKDCEF